MVYYIARIEVADSYGNEIKRMRRRAGVVTPARLRTYILLIQQDPRDRVHARLVRDRDGRTRPIQSAGETRSMHDDERGARSRLGLGSCSAPLVWTLEFGTTHSTDSPGRIDAIA